MKLTEIFIYSKYLMNTVPKYIKKIKIFQNEICLYSDFNSINPLVYFLKNHLNCKFSQMVDICGVDYINRKKRFYVIYNLLSLRFNLRIRIKVATNEVQPIPSVSNIFKSSL